MMWLVVGVGNPGAQYAGTRHNIGFMAVDEIVRRYPFSVWRTKYDGVFSEGLIGDERVFTLKPMTFMNRSGQSVGQMARFFRIPVERILVLHDDLEIIPGKIRVKQGGGHAGHNGLRDIEAHLGNPFWRIRLGIGRPHDKALVHSWVLSDFPQADRQWLDPLLDSLGKNLGVLLKGNSSDFVTRVVAETRPPGPKKRTLPAPADVETN